MRQPRVLVWCALCDRYISKETRHTCSLPADYRARRDARRQVKNREMTDARRWRADPAPMTATPRRVIVTTTRR